MNRLKLAAALALFVAAPEVLAQKAPKASPPDRPFQITEVDQRFLTQMVRRVLEAIHQGEPGYVPPYFPRTLDGLECQIIVTLREGGEARGVGISDKKDIMRACFDAARFAHISAALEKDPDSLDRQRIEIQALGTPVSYRGEGNWLESGAIGTFVDPGREGIRLILDDSERWFTPGELISKNIGLEDALRSLAKAMNVEPKTIGQAQLSKFPTLHWWEVDERGRTIELHRGMTFVPPQAVTPAEIDATLDRLLAYLMYRQRPDGRFAYSYHPAVDKYDEDDDEVAQSGVLWALGVCAGKRGGEPVMEAYTRGLQKRLSRVVDLPRVEGAAFLGEPNLRNQLGTTAQFCLALTEGPQPAEHAALREKLVTAMLWLQVDSGRFGTAFPPSDILDTQDRYPGQALRALVSAYVRKPDGRILDAFNRALPYYRGHFEETHSPAMTPWHIQAYARMAMLTKKQEFANFAIQLADSVCNHQLPVNPDVPGELWGAVVAPTLPAGDATTIFVAALADAHDLALAMNDPVRAERYREAIRQGVRFIMQLQVRPEECFYMRSPRDALGGIRKDPLTCELRLDGVQHAVLALMRAKAVLFPDPS